MANFQIHQDIENLQSKNHLKKFDAENKIAKKKFGENNVQAVGKNAFKEHKKTKIPVKKYNAEKNSVKISESSENLNDKKNKEVSCIYRCI